MRDPSSSLSSLSHPWAFDVFLSFRGEDTRYKFVGHLYHALCARGIRAFIDDGELKKGKDISVSLPEAIEKSRILIIIFSKNYASSAWCLDELVKIYECKETKGQLVWPLFYDVDPSEVRYQRGSFGNEMAKLENNSRRKPEEIHKWKLALNKVANLSGWDFKSGYEFEFIHEIVKQVTKILNHVPLHVADHPVGLESRIFDLKSLLNIGSGGIRMIGISGIGGIGKTTIARAIYNSIADEFDGASFVADVRENSMKQGLVRLQEELLAEITGDNDIKLGNVNKGVPIIQRRLCCMKVLLILDDVTELEHLQMLAGDREWFGPGSRIIVTTRNNGLLIAHGIKLRYEMKELSDDEALELLCWHAFKNGKPKMNFVELAKRAAGHAKGLPLALEVIGCNLYDKEPDEWTYALDKYERIPEGKIQRTLRISYDDLDRNDKQIFLDLACFFKGRGLNYVKYVLDACGLYPEHGIRRLVGKSLIKIQDNSVNMHDLIQKMGREIVRESSSHPGEYSRLWFHEDVLNVLTTNTGTKKIEGIMLDLPQRAEVQWSGNAFEKMPNLRILIVRNALFSRGPTHLPNTLRLLDWTEYPSTSLPEDFHPRKLVALNLPNSRLRLDTPLPELKQLTRINFTGCEQLTEVPNMSTVPNLTVLQLDDCGNLVKIHDSVGFLSELTHLSARNCTHLKKLPREIRLPSLKCLNLDNCSRLQRLPEVLDKMENIKCFYMSRTAVQEFPSSMGNLISLKNLHASGCTGLSNLPCIGMLTNLENVSMRDCRQLFQNCKSQYDAGKVTSSFAKFILDLTQSHLSDKDLPVTVGCFPGIVILKLSRNNFINISACLKELSHLKVLHLDDCEQLQEIQGVPPNLAVISAKNCKALSTQSALNVFLDVKANIVMPGNMVPKCFYYYYEGGSMSFWVRKKFPMLDIGVSFKIPAYNHLLSYRFYVFLNDFLLFKAKEEFTDVKGNHSWVWQLDSYIHVTYSSQAREHQNKWFKQVDEILQEGWNHVKISWEVLFGEVTADCCGVGVNWEEVSVHDILFEKPDTENACGCAECREANDYFQEAVEDNVSTFSSEANDDISRDELVTDPNTLQKSPSHSSIVQQQRCVTGINHHMSENSERVAKDKGKGVMIHEHQEVDSARELLLLYPQDGPITLECVNKNSLPKNQISSACIPDKKFSASYEVVGRPNKDFGDHLTYPEKELNIRRLPNPGPEFQQKSTSEKNCINQKAPFAMAAASTERAQVSWETSFSEQMNPPTAVEQGGSEHGKVTVSNEPHINDNVAFYDSLNEEMGDPSSPQSTRVGTELANNRRHREETKKALKILGDFPQIAHDETTETEIAPRNEIVHTLDDEEMEAFYASLDAEAFVNTKLGNTNAVPSEETQRALKALDDFLRKDFSVLLDPNEYRRMKATLDYLSNLSGDDRISIEKGSLIMAVSREFTNWSLDYNNASRKIEVATANLLRADEVHEGLEVNKKHYREVVLLENELQNQLSYLEERKRELEEQIIGMKANISASEIAKKTATKRKKEIFEEAKMLKAQRDKLRRQIPKLKEERELAKKIQTNIRAKWSKLGKKLNNGLSVD